MAFYIILCHKKYPPSSLCLSYDYSIFPIIPKTYEKAVAFVQRFT
ncbi:hypothetical protein CU002_1746 [Enterococcus faecium]|nr:hypothetical protein [Enterococcus faecium]